MSRIRNLIQKLRAQKSFGSKYTTVWGASRLFHNTLNKMINLTCKGMSLRFFSHLMGDKVDHIIIKLIKIYSQQIVREFTRSYALILSAEAVLFIVTIFLITFVIMFDIMVDISVI